jgi:16S rRNA pseudouridine516 synthase
MSTKAPTLRLDRLLANMGYGSRREIEQMVDAGWVRLDGEILRISDQRIPVEASLSERMTVRSKPLDPPPGLATLMLHKPLGVTCSHKEAGGLVYDLLPDRWRQRDPAISTIGRLDKETSGLLLLTDDGALLHKVISPKRHVPKQYEAVLDRPLKGDEAAIFAAGGLLLEGDDKPLLPATMVALDERRARLTLTEGRYHQVRRMFAAVGNHVVALHRDRIGGLDLPADLAPGQWRLMTPADISQVVAG